MKFNESLKEIIAAISLLGIIGSVSAKDSNTLEKIKQSGVVSLGHRESSIPFSYYDKNQKVIGYSQEFADRIVAAIKQRLSKDLQVTFTPITSQNRISLLQNGTIDLECGSTSHTRERARQVAFSNTIFIVGARLLVKKNSGIKDFPDLKGKTVVTTAGTTAERLLHTLQHQNGWPQNIIAVKDHSEAFLTLTSGRAVAFVMDDALLAGERAKSKHPQDYEIVGAPFAHEAYACMMRRENDQEFRKLVDTTIAAVERSEGASLYKKWFESPIPPETVNLKLPQSPEIEELYKNPNDRPLN